MSYRRQTNASPSGRGSKIRRDEDSAGVEFQEISDRMIKVGKIGRMAQIG
jgi:hypothetical protein